MATYSVRHLVKWSFREDQKKRFIYEERITAWHATSTSEAIELAEGEAKEYAKKEGFQSIEFYQCYWMFDEMDLIVPGTEVYSLLRESDLGEDDYIDTFFDTGLERQRTSGYDD